MGWFGPFDLPPGLVGRWCAIEASGPGPAGEAHALIAFDRCSGGRIHLHHAGGAWRGLGVVPAEQVWLGVMGTQPEAVTVTLRPIAPWRAAWRLLRRHGVSPGLLRNPRGVLARLAVHADEPAGYALWCSLFDVWTPGTLVHQARLRPGLLVLHRDAPAALAATLASIAAQTWPVAHVVAGADWREAAASLGTPYVGILQAGEILPSHAIGLVAQQLERLGEPALACAEADALSAAGKREAPVFRPTPGLALMLSGTQTQGLWVTRAQLLADPTLDGNGAEALRLGLWLRHQAAARIPFVLSHRRPDAEAAPSAALQAVAMAHLRDAGLPWHVDAGRVMRNDAPWPKVTLLIPSTLRAAHAADCLRAVLSGTEYPDLEVLVGVAQPGSLGPDQQRLAESLGPRVRVLHVACEHFNFAAAINRLAGQAQSDLLCLLNDDVRPIDAGWLQRLALWLDDPGVGVAGPRLLYPDGTIQHGGVLMGLGGVCNHMNRGRSPGAAGGPGRGLLAQDVSAVTGACLLTRTALFNRLGGLDEGYPRDFNDVDFCLRVRRAGQRVIYDGSTAMHHLEGVTYHAAAAATGIPAEAARMRRDWAASIRADPFHSPNLALNPGREWDLAFPPRVLD